MGTVGWWCWHFKGYKFLRGADFSSRKVTVIDFRKSNSSFHTYDMNIHVNPRCIRTSGSACPCVLFENWCTFIVFFIKMIDIQHSIFHQIDVLHSPYCLLLRQHWKISNSETHWVWNRLTCQRLTSLFTRSNLYCAGNKLRNGHACKIYTLSNI